jgi:hypothetical protein
VGLLTVMLVGATTAALVVRDRAPEQVPVVSDEVLTRLGSYGVKLLERRPEEISEETVRQLVDVIHPEGLREDQSVLGLTRGVVTYHSTRDPDENLIEQDTWILVIDNEDTKCFGREPPLCPDPPLTEPLVWFFEAGSLEVTNQFWVESGVDRGGDWTP